MDDRQFISEFEACTLPAQDFHHPEHVRVVWLYLQRYSLLETLAKFSQNLKRFAAANGKAHIYHETITWAYVFLIHERTRGKQGRNWKEFSEANADLLDWQHSVLPRYYSQETLHSERARRMFVFPDRVALEV